MQLGLGQVRLGEQRLLGEGGGRAEVRDAFSQAGSQLGRIEQVMDASSLRALVEQVAAGQCTPDDAVRQLRRLPYADLGFARVDLHRDLRLGMPEAVYGPGKTPEHCAAVVEELLGGTDGPGPVDPGERGSGQGRVGRGRRPLGVGPGTVSDSGAFSTRRLPPGAGPVRLGRRGHRGHGGPAGGDRVHVPCCGALGFDPTAARRLRGRRPAPTPG